MVDAVTSSTTTTSNTSAARTSLASNFETFLTLLTTQLQNQNPLDPLDTNQFTQQLVQFAQVEQQLKSNTELSTLVSLQQTAQNTQALNFVGQTVAVDGDTAPLSNGSATWLMSVSKPATATINITNSSGATVYSTSGTLAAGQNQSFSWDGKDSSGNQLPDGNYKISVTATDSTGQTVAIPTQIEGIVDSADLTQSPPTLSIAGQDYTLDKLKRVVRQ